ncbi:MAG: transglutaminase-like domain-containing protein, partial [Bacteroidales bacterium]|nr:transglutaminase-like domain-containing protein [Bacteroidales bacterium]
MRTSAPMSTILSARGRCGEESTFTVAALRTAGIPARQVYTPRWAHTDDNHAWVEIWYRGEWFYMGACEPEPLVDRGWFTEPARRAMLVHTKSFGASYGNENTIKAERNFTEVNNLAKYAATRKLSIIVTDKSGLPLPGADVEFRLYNYAEFYPIAAVKTVENGTCSFETGFGDLIVWASRNGLFTFRHINAGKTDTIRLVLQDSVPDLKQIDIDIEIPPAQVPFPALAPDIALKNTERINKGIAIRQNYINGWMSPADASKLARDLSLDTSRVATAIARSMGNYREIARFIESAPDTLKELALEILETIPDKDLRDTRHGTLDGHLLGSAQFSRHYASEGREFLLNNVINPRIDNEMLSDWRS